MEHSQTHQMEQKTQQMEQKTGQIEKKPEQKEDSLKITKDMLIGDLVQLFPEAIEPLLAEGVHCIGCGASYFETLEQGLMGHGRSPEEVESIVEKLNEAVEDSRQESAKEHHTAKEHHAARGHEAGDCNRSLIVTRNAAEKVRDLLNREGDGALGIRIAVIPGGCAGFEYEFSFEKKKQIENIGKAEELREDKVIGGAEAMGEGEERGGAEAMGKGEGMGSAEEKDQVDDFVIEEGGVKFFVDAASMGMLNGAKIDYIENLQASGFRISNPNAKASCGCGHSFG
ncbi:iron-sulfur cluster assembly accessory protein [Candidatus Woesearchaeota archaeon]|nr:iron-sulfur cluster assembly accessory protein [Candidatus Woesearchaeota archaeon]